MRRKKDVRVSTKTAKADASELYSSAWNMAYDGMMAVSEKGIITHCNSAMCHIFGYEQGELINQPLDILIPMQQRQEHHYMVSNFIRSNVAHIMGQGREIKGRHKNGRTIHLEIGLNSIVLNGKTVAVAVVRDISGRKIAEKKLLRFAYYDQLTGLVNRTYFHEKLNDSFGRAKRYKDAFSLLYLDLDKFKPVNDEFGHKYGDQVLVQVSKRLKKLLRATDTPARLGGDEFVIILEATNHPVTCQLVAQRIIEEINKPMKIYSKHINVGVSVGIAMYHEDVESAEVLLKHADTAMYEAKRAGRNQFDFYEGLVSERDWNQQN
jgi:diguanylate cyclase (GGDEF)-like protein/PAS domain S-box-containing protein